MGDGSLRTGGDASGCVVKAEVTRCWGTGCAEGPEIDRGWSVWGVDPVPSGRGNSPFPVLSSCGWNNNTVDTIQVHRKKRNGCNPRTGRCHRNGP